MNINPAQMKALRSLLSKEDKQHLSTKTGKSVRLIEAVIGSERVNDEVEQAIFARARMNLAKLSQTITTIESQNLLAINIEYFQKVKSSAQWTNDDTYRRYNDIYIRLCHYTFSDIPDLWSILKNDYRDIIPHSAYCCDLIARLTGVDEKTVVRFYNQSITDF
jgi:type IV secretory pathway VirB6-like protein